jgi:hypothetical protein
LADRQYQPCLFGIPCSAAGQRAYSNHSEDTERSLLGLQHEDSGRVEHRTTGNTEETPSWTGETRRVKSWANVYFDLPLHFHVDRQSSRHSYVYIRVCSEHFTAFLTLSPRAGVVQSLHAICATIHLQAERIVILSILWGGTKKVSCAVIDRQFYFFALVQPQLIRVFGLKQCLE